jgi:SAM-dependent methyltransferase
MIPFNKLGLFFKLFSSWIYPAKVIDNLSRTLEGAGAGSLVLDVGAGTGIFTQFAHSLRKDLKYVAVDPAHGMIRYAPSYTLKVRAKAESLPLRKGIFSVVLVGDAIHHTRDPRKAIMEIKDCMAPDGALFIFDMNPDTFMGRIIFKMERLFGEPAHFHSPERLSELLASCGFRTEINRYDWRYSVAAAPMLTENKSSGV